MRVLLGGAAIMALAVAIAPRQAFADETVSAASVGEVTVVATPIDPQGASLSRTPANAQVVDDTAIAQQAPTNLADLLNANLGSMSISNGTGNGYQNDINYRGFQATSLLGAPVGLAVYFDGVRVNEPLGSIVNWDLIPVNAIENVQVQPGSNPIFGLNALGGSLVVNTRNGKDSPGAAVSVLGGSFGRLAFTGEAGASDAATHTDFFIAGNYDKQDGFRIYSGSKIKQLYGKLRWHGPDDRTLVELSGAFADTTMQGTQALPLDMLAHPESAAYTAPDSIASQMRLVNLKVSQSLNDTNRLSVEAYYRRSNATSVNSNADLDDGCFTDDGDVALAASGVPKCAGASVNGTATNAVTNANALALGFGRWTSTLNASLVLSTTRQDTAGASAQWANTADLGGHKNSFIFGGSYDQSNIDYRQSTELAALVNYRTVPILNREYGFTANGLVPSASNLPSFTGSTILSSVQLGARVNELEVYATDTFDVTDKFNITVSGSYDHTSIRQSGVNIQYLNDDGGYNWTDGVSGVAYYNPSYAAAYKYSNSGTGVVATPNGVPKGAVAGPESNNLNGMHTYDRFNPRVGFNYNIDASTGVFGSYSESMRAPTSIELSCADPNHPCTLPTGFNGDPDLKAVIARTFELGARGREGAFSWNAAVYESRLHNDIQFIATSTTNGYFFNVGATERRGFELGASAGFGRLSLSANYGYVEARYLSPFTTVTGESVHNGDRIPGIPSSTLKLRAGYMLAKNFRIGAGLIVSNAQYAHGNEDNSDPTGKVPGYAVVDLDAQYWIGKSLRLSVNVDNLFDEKYATYGLSGSTSMYTLVNQQFRTPAAPRGAWVRITYAFGGAGLGAD